VVPAVGDADLADMDSAGAASTADADAAL
jgi:hypothetical protein